MLLPELNPSARLDGDRQEVSVTVWILVGVEEDSRLIDTRRFHLHLQAGNVQVGLRAKFFSFSYLQTGINGKQ